MTLINKIDKYWNFLEKTYPLPKYVKSVKELEFKDLKKAIDNNNEAYLKKIIKRMYVNNEAYILKKCAPKNLKNVMLNLVSLYKSNKKQSFHKMLDGVPNFHRAIDKKN